MLAHKRKQKFFYFGCSLVRRFYCKIKKLHPITRRTDRRTDRVQRNMRPPPTEEGRIIIILLTAVVVGHNQIISTCQHSSDHLVSTWIEEISQLHNVVMIKFPHDLQLTVLHNSSINNTQLDISIYIHLYTNKIFVMNNRNYDHVTQLLMDLHWLWVPQRIQYKLCVLVHGCLLH